MDPCARLLPLAARGSPWLRLGLRDALLGCGGLVLQVEDRVFEFRIHHRVKDGEGADILHLHEREERSFLELRLAEGLPQVLSIFVEINDTPVHVDEDADDASHLELPFEQLLLPVLCQNLGILFLGPARWKCLEVVVLLPSLVAEDIASAQVEAPDILLARKILVDEEVLAANADADAR